jgi:hypothetical protein
MLFILSVDPVIRVVALIFTGLFTVFITTKKFLEYRSKSDLIANLNEVRYQSLLVAQTELRDVKTELARLRLQSKELLSQNESLKKRVAHFVDLSIDQQIQNTLYSWLHSKHQKINSTFEELSDISRFLTKQQDPEKQRSLATQVQIYQSHIRKILHEMTNIQEFILKFSKKHASGLQTSEIFMDISDLLRLEEVLRVAYLDKLVFENRLDLAHPVKIDAKYFFLEVVTRANRGQTNFVVDQNGLKAQSEYDLENHSALNLAGKIYSRPVIKDC